MKFHHITSPLGLRERLNKQAGPLIDVLSLASVIIVAGMLYAMNSTYIFAPGLTVGIKEDTMKIVPANEPQEAVPADASVPELRLPQAREPLAGVPVNGVFTMCNDRQFLFNGQIFKKATDALPPCKPNTAHDRGVLLIKIDRAVTAQGIFEVVEAARNAGFSAIQLAADEVKNPAGTQKIPAGTQKIPAGTQKIPAGTQKIPAGTQK